MGLTYTLRYNKRARGMRVSVYPDGRVLVTVRSRWYAAFAEQFVRSKAQWIQEKLNHFSAHPKTAPVKRGRAELMRLKRDARRLAAARLAFFNMQYGFTYNRIAIRNQRTRWGSCSRKGNINFNYKIALLAPELSDYVIVHELCHLGAFNHSAKFWQLVSQTIPDHKILRKEIKKIGLAL